MGITEGPERDALKRGGGNKSKRVRDVKLSFSFIYLVSTDNSSTAPTECMI